MIIFPRITHQSCSFKHSKYGSYIRISGRISLFCGRYIPRRTLASFMINIHLSRSRGFRFQFSFHSIQFPIVFRCSSTESTHVTIGLHTRQVPFGLCRVNILHCLSSYILGSYPSRLYCRCSLYLVHYTSFTKDIHNFRD